MLISLKKKCDRRHPPGRKVYQRGAHTIWEVDGAQEKVSRLDDQMLTYVALMSPIQLYCQNLSLFGKLFIDVKTLFFDCDNCKDGSLSRTPSLNFYSFLLHTDGCRFATGPCVRILLQGRFPTNNLHRPLLTPDCRKSFLTTTTISHA